MEIVEQPIAPKKQRRKLNVRGAFSRRRKILILAGMFVLLIVTGYLNFSLNNNSAPAGGGGGGGGQTMNSFEMLRQTRETNRQVQLLALESLLMNDNITAEERSQAAQDKLALANAMEFETAAEGLIQAQGHQDVVVQKNGENINVLVRTPGNLTQNEVTQIQLIIDSIANRTISIENITIMPIA